MTLIRFVRENTLFLSAGMLLSFSSSFGQTYFISLFAGVIRNEFGLSHGAWGGIYTVGTTASALVMIWAGGLTDRFRVRHLGAISTGLLALSCLAMAAVPGPMALIVVIFVLRFFGQGMMSHLSVVAMARWFMATRGRALSISAMGFSLGQAVLPVIFVALLAVFNWRVLWVIAAAALLLSLPILFRLLKAERTPQSIAESTASLGMEGRHWTRNQVWRHWLFWLAIPLLLGPPAWGTALFFQQVHLTEIKGWALIDYVALLPIYTIAGVTATFVSGALVDRIGTGRLMQVFLLPFAAGFYVLSQSQTLMGAGIGLILIGIGTGGQATVPNAFWAEYYGTRHLGSIKALAASIMIFGSAIGPGISGVLIDQGLDFAEQSAGIAVYFLLAALIVSFGVRPARRMLPDAA